MYNLQENQTPKNTSLFFHSQQNKLISSENLFEKTTDTRLVSLFFWSKLI